MARGGYRKPNNPAPVSVPGSGARTDGGPGDRQPIRTATGQPYGTAGALAEQQRGAPLAVANEPAVGGTADQGSVRPQAAQAPGVVGPDPFGPSQRPSEPGGFGEGGPEQLTAGQLLRIMYQKRPSPWIARLLDDLE